MAYLVSDMMADVIRRGTGVGARVLNRDDIGRQDGHHQRLSRCLVLRLQRRSGGNGLDRVRSDRSLGEGEQGARAAQPIWVYFMHDALAGAPRRHVALARRDGDRTQFAETGLLASADNPNGIMEKFIEGNLPKSELYGGPNNTNPMNDGDKPLF